MASREKARKSYSSTRVARDAKAGKRHAPYQRPPQRVATVAELDARYLRKRRLNGAFGAAPVHVWNHLVKGTKGVTRTKAKEASVEAKELRHATAPDKHSYVEGNEDD